MEVLNHLLQSVGIFILTLPNYAFIAIIMTILCLIFRGGVQTSIRGGLSFGVGIIGITMLMNIAIESLTPAVEALSERFGLSLTIIDLGYAAANNIMMFPGAFIVMFGILLIDIVLLLLKWTKTLWVDMHNVWHGSYVGLIAWVITEKVWLSVLIAFAALIISLKLADLHAKRFQEFNEIGNITLIATAATIPATFSMLVMKIIERIPGLNKIGIQSDDLKERFGVWGENMTIGAIIGLLIAIFAGYNFANCMAVSLTLAAMLGLFPKMAGLLMEGIIPLSTAVTLFMKKRFKDRALNITVDGAVLLGHPSVMSTFVLMVPISVLVAIAIPGIGFIPIASLTALPYYIGAIVPYTKGNLVHTLIVSTLWIIVTSLIATQMAGVITHGLEMTGFYTEEIAKGNMFTFWDEGGNIFTWIISLFAN
ncbi:MAG: PTS galactitol transporter subunit IIC [Clostridiales Family XIII bacterium]|jgi:PTS system galactitol-specific IIC component|nr:PTS galactitol transporter subunit IIC [Clostridiales Family XIII bacterium]